MYSTIAVILPAYNEELTISDTIKAFHNALPEASIWVINNRSSDATESIAAETIASLNCSGGVLAEERPGKGNAVRRAFLEIEADVYLLTDADMTYPASQAKELIEPVLNGQADMVVGDRHSGGNYSAENKRPMHGFGNTLVTCLVNFFFKTKLVDIMSGYRALSRVFVDNYPILVEGFEIETDMTLHALDKRFRIVEIPVAYRDRPSGSFSKLNTVQDGARVIRTITNILRYYRPLTFFGIISFLFALFGLLAGAPVIVEFIREHYIRHVPLAILAASLEVISFLLLAIGLILDSITHQDKRNFERQLIGQRANWNGQPDRPKE